MNPLGWITVGFIVIGMVVFFSTIKNIESKLAYVKANMHSKESEKQTKLIAWCIGSASVWGVICIFLVVGSFLEF